MTGYEPMAESIRRIDQFVDAKLNEAELARRLQDIKERADTDTRAERTLETACTPMADGRVEIALEGVVDVENAYEIREVVARVLADGLPTRIEIDMWRVASIDTVGLDALVAAFRLADVQGAKLVVIRPNRFVHRQLWVTGLLGLFGAPEPKIESQEATRVRRSETDGLGVEAAKQDAAIDATRAAGSGPASRVPPTGAPPHHAVPRSSTALPYSPAAAPPIDPGESRSGQATSDTQSVQSDMSHALTGGEKSTGRSWC